MIPMKCTTRTMVYAGHRYSQGDTFEVKGETDARILTALKRAEKVKPVEPGTFEIPPGAPAPEEPLVIEPKNVEPVVEPVMPEPVASEPEPVASEPATTEGATDSEGPSEGEPVRTKRAYRRRDMQAE